MLHRFTVSLRPGLDATCVLQSPPGPSVLQRHISPAGPSPSAEPFQNATGPVGNGPRTAALAFLRHTTGFRISCSDLWAAFAAERLRDGMGWDGRQPGIESQDRADLILFCV